MGLSAMTNEFEIRYREIMQEIEVWKKSECEHAAEVVTHLINAATIALRKAVAVEVSRHD